MRVIRGDIIASQIKFNVPAQTYRRAAPGATRLEGVLRMTEKEIGIEIEDAETMQAIPIRDESYTVVFRG